MKRRLKENKKTEEYLQTLPYIYIVACWARYGVMKVRFSGKFYKDPKTKEYIPLVWQYDDHNGEYPEYVLRTVYQTTTGGIAMWSFYEPGASYIADALNEHVEKERNRQCRSENELTN